MAKKIEIISKSLIITDEETGKVLLDAPKSEFYYNTEYLYAGFIVLRNINSQNDVRARPDKIAIADAINSNDVTFTETSFRAFCRENLGFKTGGSSGEDGTADLGLGWAQYGDDAYTEASPLVVEVADGETTVSINGGSTTIKSQLPTGVTDFYDVATSKITPENSGDGYTFSLGFKGKNTSNNGGASLGIDIGGSFGQIFVRDFRFPRGANTEHSFYFTSQGYALGTFLANGGIIKLASKTGTSSFYDITLQIHRTHKAKLN